jgi:aspartyl-tRNA(Asn)/glutamyl-tRNA(Gln) amidotransferase subunit A
MARTVRDAALILQSIAGYDPLDPYCANVPVDDYTASLEEGVSGWRFALAAGDYFSFSEAEVLSAVQAAAGVFSSLGGQMTDVDFPDARLAAQTNGLMVLSDAAAFHQERLQERPQDFGADIQQRLRTGAAYTAADYSLARRTQAVLRRRFEQFFEDYDILLMPTTPVPAPPIEGPDAIEQARLLTRFTAPFNLTGLPALSLPCGFTTGGLPIGLQLIAHPWAEAALLRAAYAYEQAAEWRLRKPAI